MSVQLTHPHNINNTIVGYEPDPNGRGTLSILFSCLLTLSLCVWSAVHLDLPQYGEGELKYALRYLRWSILGVFGPELIIWAAWRQYISARTLTKIINEGDGGETGLSAHEHWTMVHSFYAGMGGFVFDLSASEAAKSPAFIPQWRQLHVTPRGIWLLARCGLLPRITEADILDKNKTDASGKVICCIQVGWMLIQCVTRLAVGLPITPLEINTIGHVVCALMNYLLWWNKPRFVREPTVLRGDWVPALCAFMFMSSQVSAEHQAERDLLRNFGVKAEVSGLLYLRGSIVQSSATPNTRGDESNTSEMSSSTSGDNTSAPGDSGPVHAEQAQTCRFVIRDSVESNTEPKDTHADEEEDPETVALEKMRQLRWEYACQALRQYPAISERLRPQEHSEEEMRYREALQLYPEMPASVKERFKLYEQDDKVKHTRFPHGMVCISEELVVDRPRNWPGDDLIRHMQGHLMGLIMWCASTVYGAIHLAGWNEEFPTIIESWFWRGSAAYIVFSGVLWSSLNLFGHVSGTVWWYWYDLLAKDVRRKSYLVIKAFCCLGGLLYVVSRLYLVLEAFISLRAQPKSVYQSPSWILTIPHL